MRKIYARSHKEATTGVICFEVLTVFLYPGINLSYNGDSYSLSLFFSSFFHLFFVSPPTLSLSLSPLPASTHMHISLVSLPLFLTFSVGFSDFQLLFFSRFFSLYFPFFLHSLILPLLARLYSLPYLFFCLPDIFTLCLSSFIFSNYCLVLSLSLTVSLSLSLSLSLSKNIQHSDLFGQGDPLHNKGQSMLHITSKTS